MFLYLRSVVNIHGVQTEVTWANSRVEAVITSLAWLDIARLDCCLGLIGLNVQMWRVFSDELGRRGMVGGSLLESRDMSASRASLSILDDESCSGSDHQQLDPDVDDESLVDDSSRVRYTHRRIIPDVCTTSSV